MKSIAFGIILTAAAIPASAQDSAWGYYQPGDGTLQAGVNGTRESQLILKCVKQGKHRVYAVIVAPNQIAPPAAGAKYTTGEVALEYDGKAPVTDQWRFNGVFAMAMDLNNVATMTRFGQKLADANKLAVTLKPFRLAPILLEFNVAGAREAMQRVYKACRDEPPF